MRWTQQEYDAYQARRSQAGTKLPPAEPERAQANALDAAVPREAKSVQRLTVRIVFRRQRTLDKDNYSGSGKDILDGLRHAGLIPGDSEKEIDLQVEQEKVAHLSDQGTVIEIIW